MSSFDDEFGLFGEEAEPEREAVLPGRRIAGADERPRSREKPPRRSVGRVARRERKSEDRWAPTRRASELLAFLAKRLVTKPDEVRVELFMDETGEPVLELVVDPEDLGKVIGKSGRVAHALRTLVRATAESRVAVDIFDTQEAATPVGGDA